MDDEARNDNEMKALMSSEEDEQLLGMYLDALSHRTLFSIFGSHERMCT